MKKLPGLRYLLLLFTVCNGSNSYSQQVDTVFYTELFRVVPRDSALFYRNGIQQVGDSQLYTYYYRNNNVALRWWTPDGDTVIREGHFMEYDSMGHKRREGYKRKGMWSGPVIDFYDNSNRVKELTWYAHDAENGLQTAYDSATGTVIYTGQFLEGVHTGKWKFYYRGSAQLFSEQNFRDGVLEGELTSYYPDGKLRRRESYDAGARKSGIAYDTSGRKIRFVPLLRHAEPNQRELMHRLKIHMREMGDLKKYKNAKRSGLELQFDGAKDGTVRDMHILSATTDKTLDEAVASAIKESGWTPAEVEGKPVPMRYTITINGDGPDDTFLEDDMLGYYPPRIDFKF